jgi:hypothetical protein
MPYLFPQSVDRPLPYAYGMSPADCRSLPLPSCDSLQLLPPIAGRPGRSTARPELVEAALVLVGRDEACPVLRWNWKRCPGRQVFVDDETLGELRAGVVRTLGAVGKSSLDDAWPDGARSVDETRVLRHAPVADNLFGGDAKAEVLVPTVAELLPAAGVRLDVAAIRQAQITPITTSREDFVHNAFGLYSGLTPLCDPLGLSPGIVASPVGPVKREARQLDDTAFGRHQGMSSRKDAKNAKGLPAFVKGVDSPRNAVFHDCRAEIQEEAQL